MKNSVNLKDKISFTEAGNVHRGLWAYTEIIGGYGDVHYNPVGKSTLDEVVFTAHNIVPIGGVSYTLSKLFLCEDSIQIPSLYSETGIGVSDSGDSTDKYVVPSASDTSTYKNTIFRNGNGILLFGVGVTGTGESDMTIYSPSYREKSINLSKINSDGAQVTGTMIPFRFTSNELNSSDKVKYFGKKVNNDGITGYYLKAFETDPVIKHVWKTNDSTTEDDTETLVQGGEVWSDVAGSNIIESFVELSLKVAKKDVKEWFINLDQGDRSRINTIALFSGEYVPDGNGSGDYRDVRLFSKLCINPEYLTESKDLNILYRVYGA